MKYFALLPLAAFFVLGSARLAASADTPHDFGKWEKEIAAYEQADRTNPPPAGSLVFIGSSTIRM